MTSLQILSDTIGLDLEVAEPLRDDMNHHFATDVEPDLIAGLLGEYEPMLKYGLRVTTADIPLGNEQERVAARLGAYDAQFRKWII
jgi:hypothetical protein